MGEGVAIQHEGRDVFELWFSELNLFCDTIYVEFVPLVDLTKLPRQFWRKMHKEFSSCQSPLFAMSDNETAERFLLFFGFHKTATHLHRTYWLRSSSCK